MNSAPFITIVMQAFLIVSIIQIDATAIAAPTPHYNDTVITKFASPILWISYYPSNSINFTHQIIAQTQDGNIRQLNVDNDGTIEKSDIFRVNASSESGGPVITDLDKDGSLDIISVDKDGKLVIITEGDDSTYYLNDTKLSPLTQPIPYRMENNERLVLLAISENGTLLEIVDKTGNAISNSNSNAKKYDFVIKTHNFTGVLPDAKITLSDVNGDGLSEILLLSSPVLTYPHGALGDKFEPKKLLVIERCGETFCLKSSITAPEGKVFETIAPVAFTSSNASSQEQRQQVALVDSDRVEGSRVLIYDADNSSSPLYSGEPIGQGFRWMLVLGVADLDKERKVIVVNETPHLSGIVKFMDLRNDMGNANKIEISGYSAHTFGSRNIAMYDILDIDNDQNDDDLIIPNLDKDQLEILSLTGENKSVIKDKGSLKLNSPLSSNVLTTDINKDSFPDIIAGDQSGTLYIFMSRLIS